MEISLEDIAKFPAPGMDFPGSFAFSPDSKYATFLKTSNTSGSRALYAIDLNTGQEQVLIKTLEDSPKESLEEQLRRQRLRQMHRGITRYFWTMQGKIVIPDGNSIYILDQIGGTPRLLLDPEEYPATDPKVSSDGEKLAFVSRGEIWLISIEGGVPEQITDGKVKGTTRGLADYVAQEEMRRSSGFWWSREGDYIGFTEVDERHIPDFHILHSGNSDPGSGSIETHRYPFAGSENPKVKLGVTDLKGNTTWLDTSEYEYIARVNWATGHFLYVQCQNREQTELDLLCFDIPSGRRRMILKEESDVWINLHDMFYPLNDGRFIWASERTGYQHIYIYDSSIQTHLQVTNGDWRVDSIAAVDELNEVIYFAATIDSHEGSQIYKVSFKGGAPELMTTEPGLHSTVFSVRSNRMIDTHHSLTQPPSVKMSRLGKTLDPIHIHQNSDSRIELLDIKPPEFFHIQSESGELLSGAIYRPDVAKFGNGPYPTMLYVYGGPHVQVVTNGWNMTVSMRAQYLRQQGFLVSVLDNRGSARRGLNFESHIKNKMGTVEVTDQIDGIKHLIGEKLVDPKRIGVYGWSYGGYMSLMCLAQAPEVFKLAVAGAPVVSWDGYDTHYTERYMSTPSQNASGYHNSSVLRHVSNIQGKLLLVHGLVDENVHFRHTARLINALISEGKDYDLAMFPSERHMPRSEADRVYMERKITTFVIDNL
ncbi:MAG: DPP IV N-terminal domain-containing protein [SAR202 cluster bacterium]|nr:DPP IV N-terminal domain-containing protein [SAR202 cluster bacterium]